MKIHFSINYFTRWGQNMALSGTLPQLGGGDVSKAVYMNFQWRENWSLEIETDNDAPFEFTYRYVLKDNNGLDNMEWGDDRKISVNPAEVQELWLNDTWNSPGAVENVFMTSPFQDVLFKDNYLPVKGKTPKKHTHVFRVKAPLLQQGEALCARLQAHSGGAATAFCGEEEQGSDATAAFSPTAKKPPE